MLLLKGVADRKPETRNARRTEVQVVVDEVELGLGTDKKVARGIELKPSTEIYHEMFVGRVVAVIAVAASLAVDACVDRAQTAAQFQIGVAGKFGRIHRVGVQKEWTKRKSRIAAVIPPGRLPVNFAANTEIVPEENVAAETGIRAAGERHGRVIGVRGACARGINRADTESEIDFLCLRQIRKHGQTRAGKGHNNGSTYFVFQTKPPVE